MVCCFGAAWQQQNQFTRRFLPFLVLPLLARRRARLSDILFDDIFYKFNYVTPDLTTMTSGEWFTGEYGGRGGGRG